MRERLQKILSSRGVASRREAEKMILRGLVTVDGVPASLGDTADPAENRIEIEGKLLPGNGPRVYLMLNKPRGYVTTLSDEKGRPNAAQLVQDCGTRVYPVGRLDMNSEGLLLFTNDGELSNRITHPSGEVEKEYEVKVRGFCPESEALLSRPIELDGRPIRKPGVVPLQASGHTARFRITIHEGRNRQVRRMCDAIGFPVRELKRIKLGTLTLSNLSRGKFRELSDSELAALKKAAKL